MLLEGGSLPYDNFHIEMVRSYILKTFSLEYGLLYVFVSDDQVSKVQNVFYKHLELHQSYV